MDSTPKQPKLDYASVVKLNTQPTVNDTAAAAAREIQLTVEALAQKSVPRTTHTPMSADAKPYVPSYLAALKNPTATVMLEGVPVNNRSRPHTEAMWSSTVSNSIMEPESTASWVDDDESFLLAMSRDQETMRIAHPAQQKQGQSKRRGDQDADSGCGSSNRGANSRRGGRGGNNKGWKVITNERNHNANRKKGSRNGNGQSNNSNNNNNNGRGIESGAVGGRFDVLSDNRVMRHL